ncbi:MAG: Holliday junction resolvase RuvX [Microbacteriaceae bacterium]|nr:Holliday junction resolvase RuvX [Microbacteriaceae bacterium]
MQRGRRLAFDVGSVRIGVAVCDPDGILASPLQRIERDGSELDVVKALLEEFEPVAIYVGLPINLEGKFTQSTFDALYFAEDIEEVTNTRVRMVDERLSTRTAQAHMHSSGKSVKTSKEWIDSASAVEILERALEVLKAGREAGKPVASYSND